MSRDGWLPPGVTDRDVDESVEGYWDEPMDHHKEAIRRYQLEPDGLGYDEYNITCSVENMMKHGCKADVMLLFDKLIDRFRLHSFSDDGVMNLGKKEIRE